MTPPKLAGVRITKLKSTYIICFLYSGAQLICRLGQAFRLMSLQPHQRLPERARGDFDRAAAMQSWICAVYI